ncbi:MAG: PKD domain-containing protein [Microthrixaceae bacterium]
MTESRRKAAVISGLETQGVSRSRRFRRGRHPLFNALASMSLLVSALAAVGVARPEAADAEVPPVLDTDSSLVTADALPTVQVNGVVWDQTIVGNTVYVVGNFTQARPAGAALGTNETPRSNILAYDLTTGDLITSFAPSLNREGRVITSSPDGSRIYVGGLFTNVSGINQYRITSLDPVTGAVDTAFSAVVDYRVNAIAVTDTTVYVGGKFSSAASYSAPVSPAVPRSNLAAFDRHTGSVLPWDPSADAEVLDMVTAVNDTRVFAAGKFANVGGQTNRGLASIDSSGSGSVINWPATQTIWASGSSAAIMSISTDGNAIYGSGYHFGAGGNVESTFSADPITGKVNFVQDCHGDTYDAAPISGNLYSVSHVHYCGNIGGFPQSDPWPVNGRYSLAVSTEATGTNRRDLWGYFNWEGTPAPSLKAWYPDFTVGSIAGQSTWTIEGNDNYVIVGGEFPSVNGTAQQGLVRFAKRSIAPRQQGPRLGGANFDFNLQSLSQGQVRISFPANYDRDNAELTYRIMRDGDNANPVHQMTASSAPWDRPVIGFTDTGLAPGSTHSYVVNAIDSDGNTAWSSSKSITVASSGAPTTYADAVMADGPRLHWRFSDASGSSTAAPGTGTQAGSVGSTSRVSFGTTGAITNETDNQAASFQNNIASHVTGDYTPAVDSFSLEAWVKTNTTSGGRIMGYASSQHGTSGSYDRHLYMNNNGSITLGAYPGAVKTITSQSGLNNNQWHHIVGTVGEDGMNLYVDGVRVASNSGSTYTGGQGYYGYWKVGADTLSSWPGSRSRSYITAAIDEPAVYYKVLTPAQVAAHYTASGRTPALPTPPADSYGSAMNNSDPVFYYRLAEGSGTTANDSGIRSNTGTYVGTVGRSATGRIAGNAAASFNGSGFARSGSFYDPGHYSAQAWIKTSTTSGGQIIGFGDAASGTSGKSDRQIVMADNGQLAFSSGGSAITTAGSYNDDTWHHVVATQGIDGMKLYVDGALASSGSRVKGDVYTGYWRIGGDNVNGLSTSNNFNGVIDEAVVHDRVLTGSDIIATYLAGGGTLPNVPPVATFTTSNNFLDVNAVATASDPDGTIASYTWDFGDGSGAQPGGATTNHSYAAGGTYTITLTVTDNMGASVNVTNDVTVAPEPPNVVPVAAFGTTINGLSITANGAASIDPDGSIVSYDWSFGDGGTATGVSTSHVYAADGTYAVTLTVTDNKGATGTLSQNVTVSTPVGPVVHASDTFTRSSSNGWGTADMGGTWTHEGNAALFSASGSTGIQNLDAAGRTLGSNLTGFSATDTVASVEMSIDKPLTGGGLFNYISVRKIANAEYQLRVRAETTKTSLTLYRVLNGATTALSSANIAGMILTPGQTYKVALSAQGTSPTTLGAKIWDTSGTEPATPQVTATDSTAALQAAGGLGLKNYLSGSTTNAPLQVSYDNLVVASAETDPPPPPNAVPVASFTGTVTDQTVDLDASGSHDTDGTVASYIWSFGDGNNGSGVTTSHTYAAAGTYTVTLTVTDDDGDSATASTNVTIFPVGGPQFAAADNFERTEVGGWGSADVGGIWSFLGVASRYSVSGGSGTQTLDVAGRTTATYLGSLTGTDLRAAFDITLDKAPTGSGLFTYVALRRVGNSEYNLRVRMAPTSTTLTLYRVVNGTSTALASADAGQLVQAGTTYRVSFSAIGSGTTALAAKFWKVADGEPASEMVSTTDSTATLQAAGGLGLTNYLTGSTTNAPLAVTYDNLEVAPA